MHVHTLIVDIILYFYSFFLLVDFNDDHIIDYDDLNTYLDLVTDHMMDEDLKREVIHRVCHADF